LKNYEQTFLNKKHKQQITKLIPEPHKR